MTAADPRDIKPGALRKALVGGLQHGNMLVLDLGTAPEKGEDVHNYFVPGSFPPQVGAAASCFRFTNPLTPSGFVFRHGSIYVSPPRCCDAMRCFRLRLPKPSCGPKTATPSRPRFSLGTNSNSLWCAKRSTPLRSLPPSVWWCVSWPNARPTQGSARQNLYVARWPRLVTI